MNELRPIKRSKTPGSNNFKRIFIFERESLSDRESFANEEEVETKEISEGLSAVRKRHDRVKEENAKKRKALEKLKKDQCFSIKSPHLHLHFFFQLKNAY